ncbi:MAG TPA: rRNA maturation RNase YbeY [Candidatus Baltobacteraceae bacterium]|jgi:rRNA maturation RNase YbeY|nr:rRNA maturation RNase YbeY [Candidatus Baltobacteraceae bacterium]
MSVLRFLDRQTVRALDRSFLRRIARALLEELLGRKRYELGVHLVGALEMAALNERFLKHQGSTDVITFNHGEGAGADMLHGEIFICVDEAVIQARRFRVSWQAEAVRYLVHGLLHMEGCDDAEPGTRRAMKRRENKLLKELSRRFDFGKLRRHKRTAGSDERR